MKLIHAKIFQKKGFVEGNLCIHQGKFVQESKDDQIVDVKGMMVLPGFIDIHVHGAMGADFNDGTQESIGKITGFFAAHGTTSLLATTSTVSIETLARAVEAAAEYQKNPKAPGAQVLGVHLEGPFFNPNALGAQNPAYVQMPSEEIFLKIAGKHADFIKMAAVAPEMEGAEDFIRDMRRRGIVAAVGHTCADYETAKSAFSAGANMLTHFYNAMTPLKHREPGVVGAAFEHKNLYTQLICDFIHVHPAALRIAIEEMGKDHVIAITDAISGTGLGDGTYSLGGLEIFVKDGVCRIAQGNLAGSTLTLDTALRNLLSMGYSIADCVGFLSKNPARALGLHQKGTIAEGFDADLVVLNDAMQVQMTIVGGEIVFDRTQNEQ